MATLDKLIITAAEYKVALVYGGLTFNLQTLESIDTNIKIDTETVHAISSENPIGEKRANRTYSGKMTMQAGELMNVLADIKKKSPLVTESTGIVDATLSVTDIYNKMSRTYTGMNINSESFKVSAKDKQILIDLDWTSLEMK